ncbi:tRNA pseudouridine(38-40) synthase TruA [Lachnobacterium bovis]|uniref:tRNA pseudouridine synthase A n=1 Tax=Lachnobacterium bovis TaxID=140626 RepID=A0A1H9P9K9_9FIRM|nr:tRNA pseudouridine(38-40) synthase TruA [Lachnobacterium bovis]SER44519.1 tRNA pseudouridine38-40 synthase [Lachnobacterium bovis]
MKNYRFKIRYDGTKYNGWQHQKNTLNTIQGKLETLLMRMTNKNEDEPITVIGAGRTDAGVSAISMTANAYLDTQFSEKQIQEYMNKYLPEDISIDDVSIVKDRFHSRFNAIGKTYRYTLWCGETKPVFDRKYLYVIDKMPDLDKMNEAAKLLKGTNDYKSFCGNKKMKKSTIRTIDKIEITQKDSYIYMTFHGDGFLQNMIRILVGTLLEVGWGRIQPQEIEEILKAKDRQKAGFMAPANGLCLVEVDY